MQHAESEQGGTPFTEQLKEELFCCFVTMSSGGSKEPEELLLNRILEDSLSVYCAVLKSCQIALEMSMPDAGV